MQDLVQRYGTVEKVRNLILQNKSQVLAIEGKIADFMAIDLHRAIQAAAGKGKENKRA